MEVLLRRHPRARASPRVARGDRRRLPPHSRPTPHPHGWQVRHADASESAPGRTITALLYLNPPDWDPQVSKGLLLAHRRGSSGGRGGWNLRLLSWEHCAGSFLRAPG
jgi:hypothetical protein